MTKPAAAIIALIAAIGPAAATGCVDVRDDKERLACYDAANTPSTTPATVPLPAISFGQYGDFLRRNFLEKGLNIDVFWPAAPSKDDVIKHPKNMYPRLIFFGCFDKPFVYQMITKGDVLKNAKRSSFNSVEFYSKCGAGAWEYDLSAAVPSCDTGKRLCL